MPLAEFLRMCSSHHATDVGTWKVVYFSAQHGPGPEWRFYVLTAIFWPITGPPHSFLSPPYHQDWELPEGGGVDFIWGPPVPQQGAQKF